MPIAALIAVGAVVLAQPRALAASQPELVLGAEQVRALGIATRPVAAADAATRRRHPGVVTVPETLQRVVAAPVPGLVERLAVSVGDEVRAGQPLVTLHSPMALELQRDAQTAASQQALAASALARDEQLYAEGLIAQSRLDATRAQARQARLVADERRQALAAAQVGAAGGGTVTLVAPIAGTVVERHASVGQRVEASAPLVRIAGLGTWWVELQLPVREAAAVRVGDAVALDEPRVRGRVIAIGRAVDADSQTVLVRAQLDTAPPELRLGEAVQARVETAAASAVAVPPEAVVLYGGQSYVFVQTAPGRFLPVPVEPVAGMPGLVRAAGLQPGAAVVVQGTAALKAQLAAAAPGR